MTYRYIDDADGSGQDCSMAQTSQISHMFHGWKESTSSRILQEWGTPKMDGNMMGTWRKHDINGMGTSYNIDGNMFTSPYWWEHDKDTDFWLWVSSSWAILSNCFNSALVWRTAGPTRASHHLVIEHSNGKSTINWGFHGKIIYKWVIFHGYVK